MFTAHWSNDKVTYRHMETLRIFCGRCGMRREHTFRRYERKETLFSSGSEISVTHICHGCLLESTLDENIEASLIEKYDAQIMTNDAFEILEANKPNKAAKMFKKILAEFPEHTKAIYGMAGCLTTIGKYSEAKKYVDALSQRHPDHSGIEALKDELNRQIV